MSRRESYYPGKHLMNPSGVYLPAAGYWDEWELDYRET